MSDSFFLIAGWLGKQPKEKKLEYQRSKSFGGLSMHLAGIPHPGIMCYRPN